MANSSMPWAAELPNIAGASLPPLDLGISLQYQFCVNAGASAAADFFGQLSDFNMHDHIACSLRSFSVSVGVGLAAAGEYSQETMQQCSDAFAAGYLGLVQQELRLFHGDCAGYKNRKIATVSEMI